MSNYGKTENWWAKLWTLQNRSASSIQIAATAKATMRRSSSTRHGVSNIDLKICTNKWKSYLKSQNMLICYTFLYVESKFQAFIVKNRPVATMFLEIIISKNMLLSHLIKTNKCCNCRNYQDKCFKFWLHIENNIVNNKALRF